MDVHAQHERKQTEGYQSLRRSLESVQARLKDRYSDEGSLKNEKGSHERLIQTRLGMVRDTASRHNIRGYDHELDDEDIDEFMNKISRLLKDQKSAVVKVRRETEGETQRVQENLNGLRGQRSALTMNAQSAKERSSANESRIEASRASLKNLKFDEGGAALLKSTIEGLDRQLEEANGKLGSVPWDKELQKTEMVVHSSEEEARHLHEEMVQVNSRAGDLAKLDLLKKGLRDSQKSLNTLQGAHHERLCRLIGQEWSPTTLKIEYQGVIRAKENELEEAKGLRDRISRKLEQVQDKLKSYRQDLKKGEQEQGKCAQHIQEKTGAEPEGYLQALQECQEYRDIRKGDVEGYAAQQNFFKECLQLANDQDICRTCQRPFHNNDEKARFEQRINAILHKDRSDLEKELLELEDELKRAREASVSHTTWVRLSTSELPRIREEVKKLDKERNALLGQLEEHDQTVTDEEQSKADIETLEDPVEQIHGSHRDVEKYTIESKDLAAKQKDAGLSRTVDEIQSQLQAANLKSRDARAKIARLKDERAAARSEVSKIELELRGKKNDLNQSDRDLERKADLERQIEELRRNNESERDNVKRLRAENSNLEPIVAQEETKLADVKQRGLNKENLLQEEATRLSDSVHKLETASQQIRDYIDSGGPERLAACKREIERLEQEMSQIRDEQTQVTRELNKIQTELQSQQETKRNIADNITYRSRRRELEELKSAIGKLEAANAEADLEHHRKTHLYWDQQKGIFRSEAQRRQVQMATKDETLQQYITEFEQFFTNASKDFKKCHIEVEVCHALIQPSPQKTNTYVLDNQSCHRRPWALRRCLGQVGVPRTER